MKKKIKAVSVILALTMGLSVISGCGKKDKEKVDVDAMIEKYSQYCELGEYKGVEYTEYKYEFTEEMFEQQVNLLLQQNAKTSDITEGKTEVGDVVNISFVGKLDGIAFNGGTSPEEGYDTTIGEGRLLFDEDLDGHEIGKAFDVDVTFPDDYMTEEQIEENGMDLNGKKATFTVTINTIKRNELPEYTDEFVASVTDYKTIKEYEDSLRETMVAAYNERTDSANKSSIITVVDENADINEYPEKELKELFDDAIDEVSEEAAGYGYDLGTYVVSRYGMASEESFRDYVSNIVKGYMREKILVCAIAAKENITVSEDDIDETKEKLIEQNGYDEDEFDDEYDREEVAYFALSEKVYDFLLENGKPVEPTTEEE